MSDEIDYDLEALETLFAVATTEELKAIEAFVTSLTETKRHAMSAGLADAQKERWRAIPPSAPGEPTFMVSTYGAVGIVNPDGSGRAILRPEQARERGLWTEGGPARYTWADALDGVRGRQVTELMARAFFSGAAWDDHPTGRNVAYFLEHVDGDELNMHLGNLRAASRRLPPAEGECDRGHEKDGANALADGSCRACHLARTTASNQRRRKGVELSEVEVARIADEKYREITEQ